MMDERAVAGTSCVWSELLRDEGRSKRCGEGKTSEKSRVKSHRFTSVRCSRDQTSLRDAHVPRRACVPPQPSLLPPPLQAAPSAPHKPCALPRRCLSPPQPSFSLLQPRVPPPPCVRSL